jgi:hypothetical protein
MNLVCQVCNVPIPAADANLAEGVCHCRQCGGFFKISALLTDEAVITRIAKPVYSKLEFFSDADSLGLMIPRGGNRGIAFFLLLFSLFWNGISWPMFLIAIHDKQLSAVLFLSVFVLIGAVVAGFAVFMLFAEFALLVDRQECRLAWSVFKWSRKKVLPVSSITAVTEEVVYTKNYQPVYGVGIKAGEKTVKFGSALTEEERKWLIGELRHFLRVKG